MIYQRINQFNEYGARVGNFLLEGLTIANPDSRSKKNPRFAYLACSVMDILDLARTGSISFNEERTYLVLPSEIPPTLHHGPDIARAVIEHPSQKKEDAVIAIVNDQPLSFNLENKLNRDAIGSYLAGLDFPLHYYELAGIEVVSDKANRELSPFLREVIVISKTKKHQY